MPNRRAAILPLDEIRPYYRNPRRIDDEAVASVQRSIKAYGFNQPIVIDQDNVIVVGHTRYEALKRLGVQRALCLYMEADPAKIAAYRIVDNKTNEFSSWDMGKLSNELRLGDVEKMQKYFNDVNLDEMMARIGGSGGVLAHQTDEFTDYDQRRSTMFHDRVNAVQEGYVDAMCPQCSSRFTVLRRDLLTRPD